MRRFLYLAALGVAIASSSAFAASFSILNPTQTVGNFPTLTTGGGLTAYTDTFVGSQATFTTFTLTGSTQGGAFRGFASGVFVDQVDANSGPPQTTAIGLNTTTTGAGNAIFGWAGTFNLVPGGTGSNLTIIVRFTDNTTAVVAGAGCDSIANPGCTTTALNNYSGTFGWGFTSDTAIQSVIIGANSNVANWENYTLDDVQVLVGPNGSNPGNEQPSAIPEPSSFGLMGLAMVGLGLVRKFRK